jgi:hypothetical protein
MAVTQKQDDQKQLDLIEDLFRAVVNDGFTVYCCGLKDDPTALIAFYEWDDYVDVVTVPQEGPAAAARLARPVDVLDPPPAAVWTWEGDPEPAIWALLRLAHPDRFDAPAEAVPTPAALRVPRELQRPMSIRMPPAGKAGVRADRLSQVRDDKDMSREFFRELFDQVDSAAAISAAENFTYDGTFQFANYPPMIGPTAITQFITAMFDLVTGVSHEIYNFWELADRTAFTRGTVTFTKHNDTKLVVPFATVSQFNEDYTLLIHHQVFVDASSLC